MAIPRFTIGIPVFNGQKYLREAIDSALAQDFDDFEVIVSDNASADGTREICESYLGHRRFQYYRQPCNLGPAGNYEFLLAQSNAQYFKWLAHDDRCHHLLLSKVNSVFSSDRTVVGVAAGVNAIGPDGQTKRTEYLESIDPSVPWNRARKLFFDYPISNIFHAFYGVFRRDTLAHEVFKRRILHPVFEDVYTGCEYRVLASLAACGRIVAVDEALLDYRWHDESLYHTEARRLSSRDHFRRGVVIRMWLISIALNAELPLLDRIALASTPVATALGSISRRVSLFGRRSARKNYDPKDA